jgi:hypothetical protein
VRRLDWLAHNGVSDKKGRPPRGTADTGVPIYDQLVRERGDVLMKVRAAYEDARRQVEQDVRGLSRLPQQDGNWFS